MNEMCRGDWLNEVLYKHSATEKYVYVVNILYEIFSKHMILRTNMKEIVLTMKNEQKG